MIIAKATREAQKNLVNCERSKGVSKRLKIIYSQAYRFTAIYSSAFYMDTKRHPQIYEQIIITLNGGRKEKCRAGKT